MRLIANTDSVYLPMLSVNPDRAGLLTYEHSCLHIVNVTDGVHGGRRIEVGTLFSKWDMYCFCHVRWVMGNTGTL